MIYYIPHKQPDGTYQLEMVIIHIWRNPIRWLTELRDSLGGRTTVINYTEELARYTAKKVAAGVSE